jgi:hypothetical protein
LVRANPSTVGASSAALEPIDDEKNIVFLEFAIVEHEQKFASVRIEP